MKALKVLRATIYLLAIISALFFVLGIFYQNIPYVTGGIVAVVLLMLLDQTLDKYIRGY